MSETLTNITVLPLTDESLRDVGDQVAAMEILSAAGEFWMGLQQLSPYELQFAMKDVEMGVSNKFIRTSHSQELAALPQTRVVICRKDKNYKHQYKSSFIIQKVKAIGEQ